MMSENVIAGAAYSFLALMGVVTQRSAFRMNPAAWFILFQWIYGLGTIVLLDFRLDSDVTYFILLFLALLTFIAGALAASSAFPLAGARGSFLRTPLETDKRETKILLLLLTILSVAVTSAYYYAVGYNLLWDALFFGSIRDVVSARLAAYSGDSYFAPGYVNQFKNVILPLGLTTVGVWFWQAGRRGMLRLWLLGAVPLALFALVGTGQRTFLVFAALSVVFGLSTIVRIGTPYAVASLAIALGTFGVMSVYLGRIEALGVWAIIQQLARRVFFEEQYAGWIAFRFVYELDTSWFKEWAVGLMGISAWHPGSDLDARVFEVLHGSRRGTANLSTTGSAYYNGGVLGMAGLYFAMGWSYVAVFYRFLRGRRTPLRTVAYGALVVHLATFVSGAPVTLLNRGLAAILLLLLVRKLSFGSLRKDVAVHGSAETPSTGFRQSAELAGAQGPR